MPLRRHASPRCRPLRRCIANKIFDLFLKKSIVFSFSPKKNSWLPFLSLSLSFLCLPKTLTLDLPQWLHRSRSRQRDREPTPPRRWLHPPRRILTGSFPKRSSVSTMSHCSTAHLFRNEVFQPLTHSSTSSSRTTVGRHSVHPLSPEWPLLCRNSTQICHSRLAPPFLSEASGSSLVPKQSTGFTACWMTTVWTISLICKHIL